MSGQPAQPEVRRMFSTRARDLAATARQKAADRGQLVARFPDLAARLTQPPLGYARPDQWNGFVPPKWVTTAGDDWVLNDSPQRTALVEICAEAAARVEAGQ